MSAPTTSAAPARLRRIILVLSGLFLLAPLAVVAAPAAPAQAAGFDPAMIISDAEFYDWDSMTVTEIDSFIQVRGSSCRPGTSGTPCLKDFRQTTWTRPADAACPGQYTGASNESAAAIISKVSTACRVNPRVLLVLLQKEQSLLTATGEYLVPRRYEAATGYACPDTAPCDAQYRGLYNQLYKAAWQFKRYQLYPYNYGFVAGRANTIKYHPNSSCGSTSVTIRNQATAGLYNYTPYVPNAALLSGNPNSCSSYGNLMFYDLYTSWFQGTTFPVIGAIRTYWLANQEALGAPRSAEVTGLPRGGVAQQFERGSVYYVPGLGTTHVWGAIATFWGHQGWERGPLGYPAAPEQAVAGGASQRFEGGTVYWSGSGTHIVLGSVRTRWDATGGATGPLGFPTSSEIPQPGGGTIQHFQNGVITWHRSTGAVVVSGGIGVGWQTLGGIAGLGYPTAPEHPPLRDGGAVQYFERGAMYWTPRYGPQPVTGAILTWYGRYRWENGPLGYPTGRARTAGTTTTQTFEGGMLSYSAVTGKVTLHLT